MPTLIVSPPTCVLATVIAAPWGEALVAATPRGIAAVSLEAPRDAFVAGLERRLGGPVRWLGTGDAPATAAEAEASSHLRRASTALVAALAGDPGAEQALNELPVDVGDRPEWDRLVLAAVRAIPWGEVRSYGQIARAIGRSGAARAVGGAVGRNPLGFLVPCHRVIAGDGSLGGYGGGWWGEADRLLDLKAELLAREGRAFPRSLHRRHRDR